MPIRETKTIELEPIDPEALQQMRDRGGDWAAYQNQDLSHPDVGRLAFLQHGPWNTFKEPPKQYPDTHHVGLGWRYRLIGTVDLESGEVKQ